jgi:dihydrofolate reductase
MSGPLITLIVAMTSERVIGQHGRLPWHLPADLRRFREITMGKPIVMGRKTHESIGRPLPGRENIVISSNLAYRSEGCVVVRHIEEALAYAGGREEVMIIGGASIYAAALPMAERIHLTLVHAEIKGDVYFPEYPREAWREVHREDHPADQKHAYSYSFLVLEAVWTT